MVYDVFYNIYVPKEARGGKGLRTGKEQNYGELFLSANFWIIDFRVIL